jgi:hypothetical protein
LAGSTICGRIDSTKPHYIDIIFHRTPTNTILVTEKINTRNIKSKFKNHKGVVFSLPHPSTTVFKRMKSIILIFVFLFKCFAQTYVEFPKLVYEKATAGYASQHVCRMPATSGNPKGLPVFFASDDDYPYTLTSGMCLDDTCSTTKQESKQMSDRRWSVFLLFVCRC